MQERRLYVKAETTRHFLNDVQLDGGSIGHVVNGEQNKIELDEVELVLPISAPKPANET